MLIALGSWHGYMLSDEVIMVKNILTTIKI